MTKIEPGYVMFVVRDMKKSAEFYSKLLQTEVVMTSPRWTQFELGNLVLGLHAEDSWSDLSDPLKIYGVGQKGSSFGFWVEDMEEYLEYLKDNKIAVIHGPRLTGLGNTIYVSDPDGYYIQICEKTIKENS